MEEGNACEIINGESDAKSSIYVKWESHKAKSWTSQKSKRERERAKEKQCLYKSYTVKGDVWVKQHEKGDHIVIKSLKDIDKI